MDYYTLDRKTVAKMLNVSTRTIDRYVVKKMFSTKKNTGKIFFHKKEIEDFIVNQNTESIDVNSTTQSNRLRQIQDTFESAENFIKPVENMSKNVSAFKNVEKIDNVEKYLKIELDAKMYKNMYETTQRLFKSQQEQLQQAYYKIGQLETQARNSIPLLNIRNEQEKYEELIVSSQKELKNIQHTSEIFEYKFKNSQIMKNFYLISTIITIFIFSFLLTVF